MPDSTSSDPDLPDGWLAASSAFDHEPLPADASFDAVPAEGSRGEGGRGGAAMLDQFEIVRQAMNMPIEVPHELLRSQIDRALDTAGFSPQTSSEPVSTVAPVISLRSRRERSSRWLIAAASVAVVGAAIAVLNQGTNARDDRSDAALTTESDLAEKSITGSAGTGGAADDQFSDGAAHRPGVSAELDAAAPSAGESRNTSQDSATPPAPSLGDFADDQQLVAAIAELAGSGTEIAPSPTPSESGDIETPTTDSASSPPTCPGDPTDTVIGRATVAGVPTLVTTRGNETRFTNLVTCVARTALTGR